MKIAIALFPRFTATDAIGPYEILSRLPGATLQFVSADGGILTSDTGFLQVVTEPLDAAPAPEILVVPGGPTAATPVRDPRLLDWVRAAHNTSQWTASVCTGALILGAAGLLRGCPATTHWSDVDQLAGYGADVLPQRVVFAGKIVTAAGVSAGFDMALALAGRISGDAAAMAIQLGIEYDPQPPYDAGCVRKAPAPIRALVEQRMRQAG
ncbi:DJ-1/PfpI family protein [Tahibacter amnicola]|uniref:DJ-1/PfpI family protein n=1 Tax=Tahibacter amnicola TaxID=2976241 RepID=A0ABY6BHT5_9GAMM|nr:DJ-1/PfpI family protein [Tahibacter amnicola]UXI67930.1 DJ-1/PfpI family protein [Tahibacter amnicola]